MNRYLQWIEQAASGAGNRIAHILLRVSLVNCTMDEVKRRQQQPDRNSAYKPLDEMNDPAGMAEYARELYQLSLRHAESVADKYKVMLTLSGLLVGLISIGLSRTPLPWLLLLPLAPFSCSIFLLVVYLGVGVHWYPDVAMQIAKQGEEERQKSIANDYMECARDEDYCTAFLVDVFRAARRWFIVGLALSVVAIVLAAVLGTNAATASAGS